MGEIREKCAVVGVFSPNAAEITALALRELDHRGPDSTGIGGITPNGTFESFHAPGRAQKVLTSERINRIGMIGLTTTVGHCRYATSGGAWMPHPIDTGSILYGENGNGSDLAPLEDDLYKRGIDTSTMNDSEMSAHAIGERVKKGASIVDAIIDAYPKMVGAHAAVIVGKDEQGDPMLAAYRDPCGLRPLVLGETKEGGYMVASETRGLDAAGATYIKDVEPGGMVVMNGDGYEEIQIVTPNPKYDPFEIIYFSNRNSQFMGRRIGDIRAGLGGMLAVESDGLFHPNANILAIPNSAKTYAEGYSEISGKQYQRNAIRKINDDRTFLQTTQLMREALRNKTYVYNGRLIKGFPGIALDDSLVRNTTAPLIYTDLKFAGATSVDFGIASPMIMYPNFYGINIPDQDELIAARMTVSQIRKSIRARHLAFLSLEGMLNVFTEMTGVPADHFDLSSFTGDYPIPIGNRPIRHIKVTGYAA